jgi:hypothetical protein
VLFALALPSFAADPSFGSDASIAYGAGALLGEWPEAGMHGFVLARYDAFAAGRDDPGPRIGASIWASRTVAPLQNAHEDDRTFRFPITQYGVMAIIRHDPASPLSFDAGLGFGRLDLEDYWGGPHALPMLTFEAGPRFAAGETAFVDVLARAQWATAGDYAGALAEWWEASLQVAVGAHVR